MKKRLDILLEGLKGQKSVGDYNSRGTLVIISWDLCKIVEISMCLPL